MTGSASPRRGPLFRSGKPPRGQRPRGGAEDRKSTRLNSSNLVISYAVFCLTKKNHICIACLLARAAGSVAGTNLIEREVHILHLETLRNASDGSASDLAPAARPFPQPHAYA